VERRAAPAGREGPSRARSRGLAAVRRGARGDGASSPGRRTRDAARAVSVRRCAGIAVASLERGGVLAGPGRRVPSRGAARRCRRPAGRSRRSW
jgi:hypothetical protein